MKKLLMLLVGIICIGNACTAIAPTYFVLLVSRFVAGLPHGAFFGAAAIVPNVWLLRGVRRRPWL